MSERLAKTHNLTLQYSQNEVAEMLKLLMSSDLEKIPAHPVRAMVKHYLQALSSRLSRRLIMNIPPNRIKIKISYEEACALYLCMIYVWRPELYDYQFSLLYDLRSRIEPIM
ncbi:MAG: hypothetical protein HPY80_00350 [Bacteroidales bacterium]|nr:hypothetical protein [Bacteroidales bacterium]